MINQHKQAANFRAHQEQSSQIKCGNKASFGKVGHAISEEVWYEPINVPSSCTTLYSWIVDTL